MVSLVQGRELPCHILAVVPRLNTDTIGMLLFYYLVSDPVPNR